MIFEKKSGYFREKKIEIFPKFSFKNKFIADYESHFLIYILV